MVIGRQRLLNLKRLLVGLSMCVENSGNSNEDGRSSRNFPNRQPPRARKRTRLQNKVPPMKTANFLHLLETRDFAPRKAGNGWQARCPGHEDHNASLSVSTGTDERILLKCHAGCPAESVVAALGLSLADLYPSRIRPGDGTKPRIIATYDYTDEGGKLLFQCVRYEPKDFRQRQPNPQKQGKWLWSLSGVRRVLYRLPEVKAALSAGMTIFLAEGEKDCGALATHGFSATCNPMGAGKWQPEHTETLRGAARVIVLADKDVAGRKHAEAVATALHGTANSVKVIQLPDVDGKPVKDASDFFTAGGTGEQLRDLVNIAQEFAPEPEWCKAGSVASEYLAPADGDNTAGGQVIPQKPVERKTPGKAQNTLQGSAVDFADMEPWPEAVDGAEVLNAAAQTCVRYLSLPDGAADALALWCGHAHAFDAFVCSPRLNIASPEKQCGKTTLRDVIAALVPRPLATENLSVAVLFRVIEAHKPTLLADECDAWLRDNEELRGMLNAGHRYGGKALRCVGDGNEVRAFNVFSPAVLCGIGSLPATLHDRSIVVRLERAKAGEVCERFDSRRTQREQELSRKLARFCADNRARLETCDPVLPSGAFNRLADNWRPLFAIAEIAGGDWPQRAATAFAKLVGRQDADAHGLGAMLLADIRQVFNQAATERMLSKQLVESLCALPDRPWPEANKGRTITQNWLARRLREFGVSSKSIRADGGHGNGYESAHFQEAFDRYLPTSGPCNHDSVTTPVNAEPTSTTGSVTPSGHVTVAEAHHAIANSGLSHCHGLNLPASERSELVEELA